MLLGGESPSHRKTTADRLHDAIPNSRIAVMPGEKHTAMNTSPDLFLKEILTFLTEPVLELQKL
jgi:pimeloyl-ACP methyl ester carboxylesterase